jgi:hypothetical protein
MGSGLRPWGMGEARTWTLAATLEFLHANEFAQPNTGAAFGRFEARVYASEKGSRATAKTPAGSRLGPLQHGLRGV